MKTSVLLPALLTSILCLISTNTLAAGGHGGHGSSSQSGGKSACKTTIIGHFNPAHLASVTPQSEFSFWIQGIKPEEAQLVEVTAKKLPVTVSSKANTGFILFKGQLPESLSNTAARIQVKVHSTKCPAQKGWLLKIK